MNKILVHNLDLRSDHKPKTLSSKDSKTQDHHQKCVISRRDTSIAPYVALMWEIISREISVQRSVSIHYTSFYLNLTSALTAPIPA